ncbi:MAG: DUF86 domain-containing protein [Saccharospirillaceae bacterium]|nr:DUF86 domain-containing protein [Pseudomonadales bacterium]NRB80329.1 DUF86 domain-containing protein [Saccharospirillaceae bacterium]
MDHVIEHKVKSILICIGRVKEDYKKSDCNVLNDISYQDSIIMNLQRAVERCKDIANRLIKINNLCYQKSAVESFELLKNEKIISGNVSLKIQRMILYIDLIVKNYQKIDTKKLESVVNKHIVDFELFSSELK